MQFKNCLIIFIQALLLQKIHSTIWNAEGSRCVGGWGSATGDRVLRA